MGISSAIPNATITEFSLTDGGDSFVDTVAKVKKGAKVIRLKTIDPTGQTLTAKCALLDDETALVGLTEASGINLISESDRNPATLTNIGSGNILAKLVERGYKTIIVGVGGSATNDGGIGLLIPLGFKFLDEKGQPIEPNGRGLAKLAEIVPPENPIPARFIVATDVDIPLLGEHGAALVLPEEGLDGKRLFTEAAALLRDETRLAAMHEASLRLGVRDATERIYETVMALVK